MTVMNRRLAQDSPCLRIAFTLHMALKILYLLTYLLMMEAGLHAMFPEVVRGPEEL